MNNLVLIAEGKAISVAVSVRINVISDPITHIYSDEKSPWDVLSGFTRFNGHEVNPIHFLCDDIRLNNLYQLSK